MYDILYLQLETCEKRSLYLEPWHLEHAEIYYDSYACYMEWKWKTCFCDIDCDRESWHDENHCFFLPKYQHFVADSWFLLFCRESVELRIWINLFTNTVVALLVIMSIRKGLVQKHCVYFYSSQAVTTFCRPMQMHMQKFHSMYWWMYDCSYSIKLIWILIPFIQNCVRYF